MNDIKDAPEDEAVILFTEGEWVGEARMLRNEDTGEHVWAWANGTPVHPNNKPLGWQRLPSFDATLTSNTMAQGDAQPYGWSYKWNYEDEGGCLVEQFSRVKPEAGNPYISHIMPLYLKAISPNSTRRADGPVVERNTRGDILDHFATAYRVSTDALGVFLARYPEHTSDLIDYAHELNLVRACVGDKQRELTAEQEAQIETEVARMSKVRKTPIILVCTVCSGRCSADPIEYERKQVAFCACGQRAIPQDEAYFKRRNAPLARPA